MKNTWYVPWVGDGTLERHVLGTFPHNIVTTSQGSVIDVLGDDIQDGFHVPYIWEGGKQYSDMESLDFARALQEDEESET